MASTNTGFLKALGLEASRDDVEAYYRDKARKETVEEMNNFGLERPVQRAGYAAGKQIGAALGKKFGLSPDQIPPEQQAKLMAREASQKRMSEWALQNQGASADEKSQKFYQFAAEEAYNNGLGDIGAQASAKLEELQNASKIRDWEMNKLKNQSAASDYAPEQAKLGLETTKAQLNATRGVGRLVPYWQHGEEDPNQSRMGFINPEDYSIQTADGESLPMGEYTTIPPKPADAFGRGGRAAGGGTPTEYGALRNTFGALQRKGRLMMDMKTVLDESVDSTGTIAVTGNTGKLASFVGRWANDIYNTASILGGGAYTSVGRDGKSYSMDTVAGRRRFAKENATVIDQYLPPELLATAEGSDRWRSLMVDLMYVQSRASEPNAKQFSDADIVRNGEIIGANVNNPEALRQILLRSYEDSRDAAMFQMSMFDPALRDAIVSPDAQATLEEQHTQIQSAYGQSNWAQPGSVVKPGEGLGTQGEPDEDGWYTTPSGVRVREKR